MESDRGLFMPAACGAADRIRHGYHSVSCGSGLSAFPRDPVEDLSDYSRTEIKEAVKTMDAGESSLLTEEILNLLPDSGEPIQRPTQVTSEQVRELTPTMTREEGPFILGRYPGHSVPAFTYIFISRRRSTAADPFASDEAQLGSQEKNY